MQHHLSALTCAASHQAGLPRCIHHVSIVCKSDLPEHEESSFDNLAKLGYDVVKPSFLHRSKRFGVNDLWTQVRRGHHACMLLAYLDGAIK